MGEATKVSTTPANPSPYPKPYPKEDGDLSTTTTSASKKHLFLVVNGAKEAIDIPLPYTIGLWGELDPVEIELKQGRNTLGSHHSHYCMRGITIRDFTLTPVQ